MEKTIYTPERKLTVITGCYQNTRGGTVGMIAEEILKENGLDDRVEILRRGNGEFLGDNEGKPLSSAFLEELREASTDSPAYIQRAVDRLSDLRRKAATSEEIARADLVYAADNFVLGKYAEQGGENAEEDPTKYSTMLQGAGIDGLKWGIDMDDTTCSFDFVDRVIVPRNTGGTPEELSPKDARYWSIDGTEYRAGDSKAHEAEARDVLRVGQALGNNLVSKLTA